MTLTKNKTEYLQLTSSVALAVFSTIDELVVSTAKQFTLDPSSDFANVFLHVLVTFHVPSG